MNDKTGPTELNNDYIPYYNDDMDYMNGGNFYNGLFLKIWSSGIFYEKHDIDENHDGLD